MRRWWPAALVTFGLIMAMTTLGSIACGKAVIPPRATWVWNAPPSAQLLTWATRNKVKEIYVYVHLGSFEGAALDRLRDLKRRADAAGVRISALGGDPGWTYDHATAVRWRRAVLASGLFSGTHLDVEPHLLTEWKTDQAGAVRGYLEMLDAVRAVETVETAGARPLEVDVTFWYGSIPAPGGAFADEILRRVDGVTVMSYRDRATGTHSIMEVGADFLERGTRLGKKVRLGAEATRNVECPSCTFYEEGARALAKALTAVDTAAAGYGAYQGMAVHDYQGWTDLRR